MGTRKERRFPSFVSLSREVERDRVGWTGRIQNFSHAIQPGSVRSELSFARLRPRALDEL